MRILHLAPLWFPVSRHAPGGIETFLAALLPELQNLGYQCTLLATGDSQVEVELTPVVPTNLVAQMERQTAAEYAYYEQHQLAMALRLVGDYDIIHSHLGSGGYLLSSVPEMTAHVAHTQHNPVTPDLAWFVGRHPDLWLTTVSRFQAEKLWQQGAARCQVIYNGITLSAFPFQPCAGEDLVFLGRIEAEKGADLAVQTARHAGRRLTLAGPITDYQFFVSTVEPFLGDDIRYIGTVDHQQKIALLGAAGCALLPSRWDEPFGLVAIEAMACGTPVVALASGALPEVVDQGITGLVTSDCDDLPKLVSRALTMNRRAVRDHAASRFDLHPVAQRYAALYEQITASRSV